VAVLTERGHLTSKRGGVATGEQSWLGCGIGVVPRNELDFGFRQALSIPSVRVRIID